MISKIDEVLEKEINSVYQEGLGLVEVLKQKGKPTPIRIMSWAMRVSQLISHLYGNESPYFLTFNNALYPYPRNPKQSIASLLQDDVHHFLSMNRSCKSYQT